MTLSIVKKTFLIHSLTSYLAPLTCLFIGKRAVVHNIFALYKKAIRSIHPLCSPRSTPTWPFDVKPLRNDNGLSFLASNP